MKKIFSLLVVFICLKMQAQTPFLTPVTYRGAFAPAPTTMWTNGWTNWDPQNANYGTGITDSIIQTPILSNLTLNGAKKYLIKGLVYVDTLVTLTIRPGCIIKGDPNVANSSLIITRGGKIDARGTASKPIVFTSYNNPGSRAKGDWGGVILLGKAHYNGAGGQNYIEGIAQTAQTQYGGASNPDDNDSSGIMQYCRIEFGGYIFAANQEINGLTFGAVGRKTVIDHIQVSFSNDDAYEWFGGTVNCKYLIAYRCLDDNFDTDNGYSGAVQFALGVRDPNISDNPAVSTSEGFESDNDAAGSSSAPYTSAIFTNLTEIGPLRGSTSNSIATGFRRNVRIRRNSHLRILNSILMDYPTGVFIDGAAAVANATGNFLSATSPGNLVFKNNLLAGQQPGKVTEKNVASFDITGWFGVNKNDSLVSTSGILITPYNFTAPDYRPGTGSPALVNYNWNDSAFYYIAPNGTLTSLIACPAVPATPGSFYGPTVACSYIGSGDTAKYYLPAKSIAGILKYDWSVPTGVTIVSGQGTDTLVVTFNSSYTTGNIMVRNLSYCGVYGAYRSNKMKKGVPGTPGIISGPTFVCNYITNGDTAFYSVPVLQYAYSYTWTVPAGATIAAGSGTNTIGVLFNGSFTSGSISVKGSTPCGDGPSRILALSKVSASPGLISGNSVTCGFTGTNLIYSIVPVPNATSYLWTVPAGAVINGSNTGTSISVTYNTVTYGVISVKAITSCGESAARTLKIAKVGIPTSISGPVVVCPLDEPSYTVTDTLNNASTVTYTWTVPAGMTITSGQGTPTITVSVDASFLSGTIGVKAVGCGTYGSTKTLAVSKDPACKRFSFTAKNGFASAATTPATNQLSVYPNPSKGNFTVYFASKSKASQGTIEISNSYGQVIFRKATPASNGVLNEQVAENKLAPGIYSVKCIIGTETQVTKMVIQ